VANSQQALLNSLGFNPLSVLWEVTPYSFVADYFFGIGNFLSALTGTAGFTDVSSCRVVQTVTRFYSSGVDKVTQQEIQRIPDTLTIPEFPGTRVAGLTGREATNIAALLAQRIRSR